MEYFDHKVLLHPRRAGANASRCWLPVQYGEANALDTSHRSSHHPLEGAPREPSLVSIHAVDVITRIDIGAPLLFWNELTSSAPPIVGTLWDLKLLKVLICPYVGL